MREKIKLESSAGTGHFYTTTKNKKNMPDKMEITKFDPVARKHVSTRKRSSSNARLAPNKKSPRTSRAFVGLGGGPWAAPVDSAAVYA